MRDTHTNSQSFTPDRKEIIRKLLPMFILIGIVLVVGILFLLDKIRVKFEEKEDRENRLDLPPRYNDLTVRRGINQSSNQLRQNDEQITRPPSYEVATGDDILPSYEFVNDAFVEESEQSPPAYELPHVNTNQTLVYDV